MAEIMNNPKARLRKAGTAPSKRYSKLDESDGGDGGGGGPPAPPGPPPPPARNSSAPDARGGLMAEIMNNPKARLKKASDRAPLLGAGGKRASMPAAMPSSAPLPPPEGNPFSDL